MKQQKVVEISLSHTGPYFEIAILKHPTSHWRSSDGAAACCLENWSLTLILCFSKVRYCRIKERFQGRHYQYKLYRFLWLISHSANLTRTLALWFGSVEKRLKHYRAEDYFIQTLYETIYNCPRRRSRRPAKWLTRLHHPDSSCDSSWCHSQFSITAKALVWYNRRNKKKSALVDLREKLNRKTEKDTRQLLISCSIY